MKRIAHKERSQPQGRKHLGILEKKKDYKKRADDYHRKEDRIKVMQQKASMRNPDEFYFGMNKTQMKDGKHQVAVDNDRSNLSHDVIRLMKDQDLSYVRMQKQKDSKKVDRLKSSLHLMGVGEDGDAIGRSGGGAGNGANSKKRKHTIFLDNAEDAKNFNVAEHFDTLPEIANRAYNRPRISKLRQIALQKVSYRQNGDGNDEQYQPTTTEELEYQAKLERKQARKVAKARLASYGELEARTKRVEAMELAEAHLVTEKLVQGKGRKRKIKAAEDGKPAQYKWRRKRLR